MCGPAAIAGVAVGGELLNAYQQQQEAERNQKYEDLVYGQRKADSIDAVASLVQREHQEREAAASDIQELTRRARQASSAAKLQAVEAGVTGRSVQALLNQFESDRLTGIGATERNLEFATRQLQAQARSAARVTPARKFVGPFDTPFGVFSTFLGAGAAGAGVYGQSKGY